MKTRLVLKVECADAPIRRALASVLAPDNESAPHGLRISMEGEGQRLIFVAESESHSTVISTGLAFLKDAALFEEVWLLSQGKYARVRRG